MQITRYFSLAIRENLGVSGKTYLPYINSKSTFRQQRVSNRLSAKPKNLCVKHTPAPRSDDDQQAGDLKVCKKQFGPL